MQSEVQGRFLLVTLTAEGTLRLFRELFDIAAEKHVYKILIGAPCCDSTASKRLFGVPC